MFGVLLMVLDAFYTQTNGILTTGGVVSLLIGSFTLFDFQGIERSVFELAWWNVVITVGIVTAFFAFIVAKGLLAQRKQPAVGIEAMIGAHGRAKDPIARGARAWWWCKASTGGQSPRSPSIPARKSRCSTSEKGG